MIGTRKESLLGNTVIISTSRARRFKSKGKIKGCVFCPGNEKLTQTCQQVTENGKWIMRSVKNKFPIAKHHEVIIETRAHSSRIDRQSIQRIEKLFMLYADRYKALLKKPGVKYVQLFSNRGHKAGASITHAHSQIIGLPFVPKLINEEMASFKSGCDLCGGAGKAAKSGRLIYKNRSFAAFCPYAPRFTYEIMIIPMRHTNDFTEIDFRDAADIYKKCMSAVYDATGSIGVNIVFHQARQKSFHAHINILPLREEIGGLERGVSVYVSDVYPEKAAKDLRERIKK